MVKQRQNEDTIELVKENPGCHDDMESTGSEEEVVLYEMTRL